MIKVESIRIQEFRGIRDLTLTFKGKNFAICGPNGTGKSGIVDALDFVLTGNISRLSGVGMGDVSLRQHGPHVDKRDDPEKACVSANVSIPGLNKSVLIKRNLKTPATAEVTPRDSSVIEILRQVKAHPEIVLSRREVIRYILATPGDRAKEVQALLHLDQVEQVRTGLQKIANACEKQLVPLDAAVMQARDNLLRAVGLTELRMEQLLASVNTQRAILGSQAIPHLTDTTSLKDGMATQGPAQPQRIPKAQAFADIQAAKDALTVIAGVSTTARVSEITGDLISLAGDPAFGASAKREAFYSTGIELIEAESCPFCDTTWDVNALKEHVQAKVDHLAEISRQREAVETKIGPLITAVQRAQVAIDTLVRYATLATPPINMVEPSQYVAACRSVAERLSTLLPLPDTIAVLSKVQAVPQAVLDAIGTFESTVVALPEPTKHDAAREWLAVAEERLQVWRDALRKQKIAKDQAQLARQVSDIYATTSDAVLKAIYADVETDFGELYSAINRDDEAKFTAQLTPSMGKLGFDVDFYGRGFFPPGAYHSEGHQDGMGLCLYLALMRHLHGSSFTVAVLDDVLMSVDAGHRREVCALLKKEFPNTQFIMTTHDPIWLRHMGTEGLIGGRIQFKSWSVDHGPTEWDERDVWKQIDDYLGQNDVRGAAALLRHYLEYMSSELCDRLHAPVPFRGDAHYQLGELLPNAIARLKDLYRRAKGVANSWNQKDVVQALTEREDAFSKLANASNAEQWQVNVAVHFNSWDNLIKTDFAPVAQAFQALLRGFACADCDEYFRVSPDRESPESIRCGCGKTNINLCKK